MNMSSTKFTTITTITTAIATTITYVGNESILILEWYREWKGGVQETNNHVDRSLHYALTWW